MSLKSIAKNNDNAEALAEIRMWPREKNIVEKSGAIIPAAIQATAKFVKNSENILPTD